MTTDIIPHSGAEAFRASTDAANLCKQIVIATAKPIKGRRFVGVEGWQAIALAHGCVASSGDVERTDTGFRAIGRVVRMSDGMVLSTAEGFVGDDETAWAVRPEYARRAMAQTRSISRACRSAFAHVVVMMQAGLETTPAEEIPIDGETLDAEPKKKTASKEAFTTPAEDKELILEQKCRSAEISPKFYFNRLGVEKAADIKDEDWVGLMANLDKRISDKAAKAKAA